MNDLFLLPDSWLIYEAKSASFSENFSKKKTRQQNLVFKLFWWGFLFKGAWKISLYEWNFICFLHLLCAVPLRFSQPRLMYSHFLCPCWPSVRTNEVAGVGKSMLCMSTWASLLIRLLFYCRSRSQVRFFFRRKKKDFNAFVFNLRLLVFMLSPLILAS